MKFKRFSQTDWNVSTVSMGCWALGSDYGDISDADADHVVQAALDAGVNFFDTADGYGAGLSERRLGKSLKSVRNKVFIASKVGNWARAFGHPIEVTHPLHVIEFCHASLFRLNTDYIDLYQCHLQAPNNPEIFIEAFEQLKKDGLIRAYGISTNKLEALMKFNSLGDCNSCQLDYSILRRGPEKDLLPYCKEQKINVLARCPLRQGMLTGKFTADSRFTDRPRQGWNIGNRKLYLRDLEKVGKLKALINSDRSLGQAAIRFVCEHDAVTCAIPGMKDLSQVTSNTAAADLHWDKNDQAIVEACSYV